MTIQSNSYSLALSGVKWLPVAMAAQAATVGIGMLAGWVSWDTVKAAFTPAAECPLKSVEGRQKLGGAMMLISGQPAIEEFGAREIFQNQMLTVFPTWILGKIVPGSEWIVKSTVAKVARTVLSGGLFSYSHYIFHPANAPESAQKIMNFQVLNTLGIGLALSALRERTGSSWPAFGLHVAWNVLTMLGLNLYPCFQPNEIEIKGDPMPKAADQEMCPVESLPVESLSPFNHQLVIYHPSCPKGNQRLIDIAIQNENSAEDLKSLAKSRMAHAAALREQASEATIKINAQNNLYPEFFSFESYLKTKTRPKT
jgi:membrane protease YdiL (CAAX protease family)